MLGWFIIFAALFLIAGLSITFGKLFANWLIPRN